MLPLQLSLTVLVVSAECCTQLEGRLLKFRGSQLSHSLPNDLVDITSFEPFNKLRRGENRGVKKISNKVRKYKSNRVQQHK